MVDWRSLLSDSTSAAAVLVPIVLLPLAVIFAVVGIFAPWWSVLRFAQTGNAPTDSVSAGSQISLWAHIGCARNETWLEICNLEPAACKLPAAAERFYIPPWTPPPLIESTTPTLIERASDMAPTTVGPTAVPPEERRYACVSGAKDCNIRPPVTPVPASAWGEAPTETGTGVKFGDKSANVGNEATSDGEDQSRIPPSVTAVPVTTPQPTRPPMAITGTLPPEVINTPAPDDPKGVLAGIWSGGGSGTDIKYDTKATEADPRAQPRPSGPPPSPPMPGVQMAAQLCPPAGMPSAFYDPYGPPVGVFVCDIRQKGCGKVDGVRLSLYAGGGLAAADLLLLLLFGSMKGGTEASDDDMVRDILNKVIPLISAFVLLGSALSFLAAIAIADSTGLAFNDPDDLSKRTHMDGPGAICAILGLVVMLPAFVLSIVGIGCQAAKSWAELIDKEQRHLTANIKKAMEENTPQFRIDKDEETRRKMPPQRGYRSQKVVPSLGAPDMADWALEDTFPQPLTPRSMLQASVLGLEAPDEDEEVELSRPGTSLQLVVGRRASAELNIIALPPTRATEDVAASPATDVCLRRFLAGGEGQIYAQHFVQPSPPSTARSAFGGGGPTARSTEEWVEKTSRKTGTTYFVNALTGEARWTPPSTAREAWSPPELPALPLPTA
ncbi:unnamed protein product, partial [Polarella glacialis]